MMIVQEGIEQWVSVRWLCDCGRWALWKATPNDLARHGLDPLALCRGRITTQLGTPPASAFDVLHRPIFNCSCGRRVPVVETLEALLRYSRGVILWEGTGHAAPASAPARMVA